MKPTNKTLLVAHDHIKQLLDEMCKADPNRSWLDFKYPQGNRIVMPGTNITAIRFSYLPRGKYDATFGVTLVTLVEFQRRLDNSIFRGVVAQEHETKSLDGNRTYWKGELFIPANIFIFVTTDE